MNAQERFWAKVTKSDGCWEWAGSIDKGYGKFSLEGKNKFAHRVSYAWEKGPIPEGLVIDHMCRNTVCVRPDHLRAVTQRENLLSGLTIVATEAKRTHCRKGHPLHGENLRLWENGRRQCLACLQANWRKKEERRRERRRIVRGEA